jgi:hypothetical protein
MNGREYTKGAYRLDEPMGDGNAEVIWYDGERWWLPGWECGMMIGARDSETVIEEWHILEQVG